MNNRSTQQGFAAVMAVFVLVVLAALGAFMVTTSTSQQFNSAQDIQGSRAYWAARAGIEWAIGSLTATPTACPTPPSPFTVDGFTLDVRCTLQAFNESGVTHTIYSVKAVASLGAPAGSAGYIERSLSAAVEF